MVNVSSQFVQGFQLTCQLKTNNCEPVKTTSGCFIRLPKWDAEAEPTGTYSRRSYKATSGGLNGNTSYLRRGALRCLLVILILFISSSAFGKITVSSDRQDIAVNESFQLVFSSNQDVDGDPDFSPLKVYFSILDRSQSSNMSIINGRISRNKSWTLTLMPKQAGKITIPAIHFGKDKSQPFVLEIKKGQSKPSGQKNQDIFIEAESSKAKIYLGEQLLVKVRIYIRLNINSAQLSEPESDGFSIKQQKLGLSSQYQTTIGGTPYTVLQQNYLVTPQTAGKGKLKAFILQAEVASARSRFFDPFGASGKIIKLYSQAIPVEVLAEPKQPHNLWIPTEKLQISRKISKGPYQQGEPINITIRIEAKNQFAEVLPILPFDNSDDYKIYADKPVFQNNPTAEGINGVLIQKMALIPQKSGKIVLPAQRIQWWNTQTEQFEYSAIPQQTLSIQSAGSKNNTTAIATPQPAPAPQTEMPETNSKTVATTQVLIWQIISLILFVLWLFTLYLYKKQPTAKSKKRTSPLAERADPKKLLKACMDNNAKQTQHELILWAQSLWPQANIHALKQIDKQIGQTEWSIELEALQHALYSGQDHPWNGQKLAKLVKQFKADKKQQDSGETIKKLYPEK